MKRGRPRKQVIEEVVERPIQSDDNLIQWDVRIGEPITFFDPNLSYELTGYRPIDATHGLDFSPKWFTETREVKINTGKYSEYVLGSKLYRDFWDVQYERCRDGMTVNGYTITGDNYYFLNFYQLPILSSATKAGGGRSKFFPDFFVKQYEYFHYIELCKRLRKNAIGLKARGLGFSEIGASIADNTYTCRRNSRIVIAAELETYVTATLSKCWDNMAYIDDETESGFRKLRQVHNTAMWRRASSLNIDKVESGFMSEIVGITADRPSKIRGDRTDVLIYEESGSWGNWKKAFLQGDALVKIQGTKFGIKLAWGTGGDSGPKLEGLSNAYYHPEVYEALPYRHNYTSDGTYVLTGYFIPAYTMVNNAECIDSRGWTDPEKGRAYYDKERASKSGDPNALLTYCAEYCYTAEEALAMEGQNNFNTILLSEQLAAIKLHKLTPEQYIPKVGNLVFNFRDGKHTQNAISGVRFVPDSKGKVVIIEHPLDGQSKTGFRNLYVAGIDGIDIGQEETSVNTKDASKYCLIVYKRAFGLSEPMPVCIYMDRPNKIEEAYRITWAILEYYKCKAVIESTKISVLTWFATKGMKDKYFMHRPKALLPDSNSRSKIYGAQATEVVIKHQLDLISTYIEDYCGNIWYEPLLTQLITYSYENKRKFDMIAALGMAMLGDEDLSGIIPKEIDPENNKFIDFGYWTDSYGVKHRGAIPKDNTKKARYNFDKSYDDPYRIRTSDSRYATMHI